MINVTLWLPSVLKEKLTDLLPLYYVERRFLKICNHTQLAGFFGLSYSGLAKIIYKTDDAYKYHQFEIPKKGGGHRKISSPAKKLKEIQGKLKEVLYEIYPAKPSVHGFSKDRSIVTNAEKHLEPV
ncbi:MAG: hypothetical protein MZV65_11115 [Chromatiales bacterium]|nr:hypothetical protein [Chromatiales bacterium]